MDQLVVEKYQTLDINVDFRSNKIDQVIAQVWALFFARVSKLEYEVDRAVWICNRFPAWVGVKPGSVRDDRDEEPEFVISVVVGEIDAMRDDIRKKGLSEKQYRAEMHPVYDEYYAWLKNAIKDAYGTPKIIKLRKQIIKGRFGVYSTQIDDLHTSELDEMDWITGDKLG
jgi:hypothetical protein